MYVYMYVCIYVCIYVCMYACSYTYVHMHVCMNDRLVISTIAPPTAWSGTSKPGQQVINSLCLPATLVGHSCFSVQKLVRLILSKSGLPSGVRCQPKGSGVSCDCLVWPGMMQDLGRSQTFTNMSLSSERKQEPWQKSMGTNAFIRVAKKVQLKSQIWQTLLSLLSFPQVTVVSHIVCTTLTHKCSMLNTKFKYEESSCAAPLSSPSWKGVFFWWLFYHMTGIYVYIHCVTECFHPPGGSALEVDFSLKIICLNTLWCCNLSKIMPKMNKAGCEYSKNSHWSPLHC